MKVKDIISEEAKVMSRAAKGMMKYGKEGMKALAKAGKEGKDLDPIRQKYDRYDEAANAAQQAAIAINMKKRGKKPKDDVDEVKQRLDPKCWTGYHKAGTKMKGGIRVNNCVKDESVEQKNASQIDEDLELEADFDIIEDMIEEWAERHGVDAELIWEDLESVDDLDLLSEAEAWQTSKGKNRNGGLNKKGVASYRRSHPGSKLQTAVTTKPSKLKKGSKASKRRKSFCARMRGMKKHRTSAKTARDPNSRINKSLRKWNC
jgi:hypothetical protein